MTTQTYCAVFLTIFFSLNAFSFQNGNYIALSITNNAEQHADTISGKMKFKKVKTIADIAKDPRVLTVEDLGTNDGSNSKVDIWIRLRSGYQWDNAQTHNVHERSLSRACYEMNNNVQEWNSDPELLNK